MVAIYALVSCLMTATYAAAIEHPRRQSRSQVPLEVSVTQTNIDFYPGETITITCQARAGASVEDMPFISFYVSCLVLRTGDLNNFDHCGVILERATTGNGSRFLLFGPLPISSTHTVHSCKLINVSLGPSRACLHEVTDEHDISRAVAPNSRRKAVLLTCALLSISPNSAL